MKTIQHEFSLELYQKAKENPDKYEFVYRDGTKPLGVFYMEGCIGGYPFISWRNTYADVYSEKGHLYKTETESSKDLFILEKVSIPPLSVKEEKNNGGVKEVVMIDKENLPVFNMTTEGDITGISLIENSENKSILLEKKSSDQHETKQIDQERLDKFVCAALTGLLASPNIQMATNEGLVISAIEIAKETIKQLEGGENE